jgi:magnesium chelatase subunit ChlD-like protein
VVAWQRTLLAKGGSLLERKHLRFQARTETFKRFHCIVLDTSGSMRQGGRLALAKGFAARLIEEVSRAGDDIALLIFGGRGVELLIPPGPARSSAIMRVRQCGGGGGTPLAQALAVTQGLLIKSQSAAVWLLTDGRTLEQPPAVQGAAHTIIVDFDDPKRGLGRCAALAKRWGAEYRLAPF